MIYFNHNFVILYLTHVNVHCAFIKYVFYLFYLLVIISYFEYKTNFGNLIEKYCLQYFLTFENPKTLY